MFYKETHDQVSSSAIASGLKQVLNFARDHVLRPVIFGKHPLTFTFRGVVGSILINV